MNHQPSTISAKPIVWTVAGSDSGGGAGIQADLKTFNGLGVHGCSVVTAVTSQNSRGVLDVAYLSADQVEDQWEALIDDLPPAAIKFGMPGNKDTILRLTTRIAPMEVFKVMDPVFASSSGNELADEETRELYMSCLVPYADLLTPNLVEAEILAGVTIASPKDVEEAAASFLRLGAHSVLVKGGHLRGDFCQDFWTNGTQKAWLTSPRIETEHSHGTGCTFASAIAACHALGYHDLDAAILAKAYVNQGLRKGYATGEGPGTLGHDGWPDDPESMPWLTDEPGEGIGQDAFPEMETPMGLYPIVDRAEEVKKLLPLGLKVLQLRIKDLEGEERAAQVREAVEAARDSETKLFINDAWESALEHGAYGVHLGQDDLEGTDLDALRKAGLRLGISTHSFTEMARALAYKPSYIAMGTLFKTTSKVMDYPPLGLDAFRRMRRLSPVPVVAIGGIHLDNAREVLEAGADGCAVISEIKDATDLEERVAAWKALEGEAR